MTEWHSFNIDVGDLAAATIVLVAEDLDVPAALASRVERAKAVASGLPTAGRWLDVLDLAGPGRLVLIGVAAATTAGRWRGAGGHVVEAMTSLKLDVARLAAPEGCLDQLLTDVLEGVLLHS